MTVVVTSRVHPNHVDDFLDWQRHMSHEESKFEGFRGTELFRPIEGLQDESTTLYRSDSAEHLDAWLTSSKRQEVLAESEKFNYFKLRTIDNSFGMVRLRRQRQGSAAALGNQNAVWAGMYPTVALLTLALAPLEMPLWLGLLVGNLFSSFLTMPYYVNPLLKRWLRPSPDEPAAKNNLAGLGIVAAVTVFWGVVFYVVTTLDAALT